MKATKISKVLLVWPTGNGEPEFRMFSAEEMTENFSPKQLGLLANGERIFHDFYPGIPGVTQVTLADVAVCTKLWVATPR